MKESQNIMKMIVANIRFDEEFLITSLRRLSSLSSRPLDQGEYVFLSHMSSENIFKTSWSTWMESSWWSVFETFQHVFRTSSENINLNIFILMICLEDVLNTSSRHLVKTSRHLQDVLKTFWRRSQYVLQRYLQDIFETFSRRIIMLNCSCSQVFKTT